MPDTMTVATAVTTTQTKNASVKTAQDFREQMLRLMQQRIAKTTRSNLGI